MNACTRALGVVSSALLLCGAGRTAPEGTGEQRQAQAEVLYQQGVDHYAHGRLPDALSAFQSSLRLDPGNRLARSAVNRVAHELTAPSGDFDAPPAATDAAAREGPLDAALRFLRIERTVGDARNRLGQIEAMQGRIAQLLNERRVARARRRKFAKDAELHALSRRLPGLAS